MAALTSRKSAIEEKMSWNRKVTLPSALIFAAKNVWTINFTTGFFLPLFVFETAWDGRLRGQECSVPFSVDKRYVSFEEFFTVEHSVESTKAA